MLLFTAISYLIVLGSVSLVLSAVQEGARLQDRPAIWGMHEWSQLRVLAFSGLSLPRAFRS